MSNKAWDCLYLYFSTQEQHYSKIRSLLALNQLADTTEANSPDQEQMKNKHKEMLSLYRDALDNIQQCRKNLALILSEKEIKFVIQALIFHVDENVLTIKMANKLWPGMQQELLQCRNGGEKFFINLNYLLKDSENHRMALEVYYFCLKQGFVGCYFNDPEKIKQYCVQCTRAIKRNATLPAFSSQLTSPERDSADILLKDRKGLEVRIGAFAY